MARGAGDRAGARPRPGWTASAASSSATRSSWREGRDRGDGIRLRSVPEIEGLREARPGRTSRGRRRARCRPGSRSWAAASSGSSWPGLAALGSAVTLVHRGERLIEREEPFAGPAGTRVARATAGSRHPARHLGGEASAATAALLTRARRRGTRSRRTRAPAALGRMPGTIGIGLETIGIEPGGSRSTTNLRVPGHAWLVRDRRRQRARAVHPHG